MSTGEPYSGGLTFPVDDRYVKVGLVKARYRVTKVRPILKDLLDPAHWVRFAEADAEETAEPPPP